MVNVKKVSVGYLQANCYIVSIGSNCLVIDPGDEADKIKREVGNLQPVAILITHDHFDHIGALKEIQEYYQVPVYQRKNLEEKEYQVEEFKWRVIFTPGHASTCVTFYFEEDEIMFTGDFLFKESIGRIDLETSNEMDMMYSLKKIKKYPDNITIYPGHGPKSTLGYEKEYNPYLKADR